MPLPKVAANVPGAQSLQPVRAASPSPRDGDKKAGKGEVFERNMNSADRARFREAKATEWTTIVKEKKAMRVMSKAESERVRDDPELSKVEMPGMLPCILTAFAAFVG